MGKIQHLLNELPSLSQRNEELLSECERMLTDEEESDNELRSKFGNNWTRIPSAKLNEPLKSNLQKYKNIITTAQSADGIVKEKYEKHKEKIAILCPTEDLTDEFLKERNPDGADAEKENMLSDLSSVHHIYKELLGNLEEGTTFYNNLTEVLVNFQNKITDFCLARKKERDELLKDINKAP